jgi:hypothetical protein
MPGVRGDFRFHLGKQRGMAQFDTGLGAGLFHFVDALRQLLRCASAVRLHCGIHFLAQFLGVLLDLDFGFICFVPGLLLIVRTAGGE